MLFTLAAIAAAATAVQARTFTVYNGCPFTVWPALYTSAGPRPSQATGWSAAPYTAVSFNVQDSWNGRIWGRRNCNFGSGSTLPSTCAVGGCNGGLLCQQPGVPPVTLAEFNLAADQDWYDVSIVDGYDLPMHLANNKGCFDINCKYDYNPTCPNELAVRDGNGVTIGCKSACFAKGGESNCCSGSHNTPQTCPASGVQYYSFFHDRCPTYYTYAYDDNIALKTCPKASQADYTITFCPP